VSRVRCHMVVIHCEIHARVQDGGAADASVIRASAELYMPYV